VRKTLEQYPDISLARYKSVVREQWAMLVVDEPAAMKALPHLLPADVGTRRKMFQLIKAIRTAGGELEGEAKRRLDEVEEMFDLQNTSSASAPKGEQLAAAHP